MQHLLEHLRAQFDPLDDRMRSFARHGVQLEGWFKGELLVALDSLKAAGVIKKFDREVKRPEGRIDLVIDSPGLHWVELKHWLIGSQRGTTYGPGFYFGDPSSVGIVKDVDKLLRIPPQVGRWLLLLLTANPGRAAWNSGLAAFNNKFAPRHLDSCTDPSEFPSSYFLGLLRVSGGAAP